MYFTRAKPSLVSPFPINELRTLYFGNADGHRDDLLEGTFIVTSSVRKFLLDNHSIIVGPIGSGKSTLFRLLKQKSKHLPTYEKSLVVAIEEAVSFAELNAVAEKIFEGKEKRYFYQLVWKFNILSRIASELSKQDCFPNNSFETNINKFLDKTNATNAYESITKKISDFVAGANLKMEAKIGETPISLNLEAKNNSPIQTINLESLQSDISNAIRARGFKKALVIIDKIDKFVAGTDYIIQKEYISSLIDVDDDMFSDKLISLKIFIRKDLFERLDFTRIGFDKINDRCVNLVWSTKESQRFLATRIVAALQNAKITTIEELVEASDMSSMKLSFRDKILAHPRVPIYIKKLVFYIMSVHRKEEREVSLFERFDKAFITKVFPRQINHYCSSESKFVEISIFDFLSTHFIDGNNVCTPRYLLIFLKAVVDKAAAYYDDNPDQYCEAVKIGADFEWDLFKRKAVYDAYIDAKEIYIRNMANVDDVWTRHFNVFLSKKGNKSKFDYKWIKSNISDLNDSEATSFLAFLQCIGFLKLVESHFDPKKREYELPILYRHSPPLVIEKG